MSSLRVRLGLPLLAGGFVCLSLTFPAHAVRAQRQPLSESASRVASATTVAADPRAEEALVRPVTVQLDNVSLSRALDAIAASAKVRIHYQVEQVDAVTRPVTVRESSAPLGNVLAHLLAGTGLRAVPMTTETLAIKAQLVVTQGTVTGKIIHAKTRQPIAGATVLLDDASKGVVSGEDGTFKLPASAGQHTVSVRAVGFVRQSRAVTVQDGLEVVVELQLEPSASVLNEVVVTGTVVATERKAIPNPITVITAKDIEERGITRVEQLLRGEVPGVVALEQGSRTFNAFGPGAMATSQVYSRGASTLDGGGTPIKTYIDGVEILDPTYLGTIDPKSIERIEIITGPQAATVYGSGAMGGVMQIFTKKGSGRSTPDVTLSLRYGVMENNISRNFTPTHNHTLTLAGGSGPEFSYSGNLSYGYTGQWQPALYNRTYGVSVGMTHARGPLTANGSVSVTSGENGTFASELLTGIRRAEGDWAMVGSLAPTRLRSNSRSQTVSLGIDYRLLSSWQHHLTVGVSQTDFGLMPTGLRFSAPSDTLYQVRTLDGKRTTLGYNTTFTPPSIGRLSSTLTVGATGSTGDQTQLSAYLASKSATSYLSSPTPSITKAKDEESWGGFGRMQIGMFERLYLTIGLRGEYNPNYGDEHKIDWTPSNGITYTMEAGELTVKALASYGRATRPPSVSQRLEVRGGYGPEYEPNMWVQQFANPNLTPEYARGPEGGIELYYGNLGSLTINHYTQRVAGLIQSVVADSLPVTYVPTGDTWMDYQYQYQNAATIRQYGWESTASANIGALTLKGTYSWTDSRVTKVNPTAYSTYTVGQSFQYVPTHTANVTASYSHGGTSVTLVTNIIGATTHSGIGGARAQQVRYGALFGRLKMYVDRAQAVETPYSQHGYAKSDLSISHRLTGWSTAMLNVTNLGNSFGKEGSFVYPALGRVTTFGMALRMPGAR